MTRFRRWACCMTDFLAKAPTLDANWRAIVLFGRNVASYRFALVKTLLGIVCMKEAMDHQFKRERWCRG